ncbi:unnamed protein product [Adineta steineri]|uniref:Uncharacterized protein n=1 Tax=Adineta steineri TaxID=433720 RepID=A0A818WM99_9BILA|nr:unnamed protein product [Adineta steineri]CAF3727624.1 unnamed protein product [Adineta steineri]
MTNINNEHEQMISVLNQLIDEREILSRENECLLIETMNEMRKERRLLFKSISNLTTKHNYDEQVHYTKQHLKEKYIFQYVFSIGMHQFRFGSVPILELVGTGIGACLVL